MVEPTPPPPPPKRVRVEVETPPEVSPPPLAVLTRSYTPPPSRDPRLKVAPAPSQESLPDAAAETVEDTAGTDDMGTYFSLVS